jgi:hypothetical protein
MHLYLPVNTVGRRGSTLCTLLHEDTIVWASRQSVCMPRYYESMACLLLYEDYVWVSHGNARKAKQSKATSNKSNALRHT